EILHLGAHVQIHLFIFIKLIFLFFNDTPTTETYTLSLHDALPILQRRWGYAPARSARFDLAPYSDGNAALSFSNRSAHRRSPFAGRRRTSRRNRADCSSGHSTRTAAPGIARHRHQTRVRAKSTPP